MGRLCLTIPAWILLAMIGNTNTVAATSFGPADLNGDARVDFADYSILTQYWQLQQPPVNPSATGPGEPVIDYRDLAVLANDWLIDYRQIVYIKWLGHASAKVWTSDVVIYVDPRNLGISPHDATLVLVTHTHSDHYSATDITNVSSPQAQLIGPTDVITAYGRGQVILPGQTLQFGDVNVVGVPTNNANHPRSNNWVGFIVELAGKRLYFAGDTSFIPEMKTLGPIDVAFLPIDGVYNMDAVAAAAAATTINPRLAVPYHVSNGNPAQFARLAGCSAKVMSMGETISSRDWCKDFSLVAQWKLDETAGTVAVESIGGKNGTLVGGPTWEPTGGMIDGALQLDGVNDYVSTTFSFDPALGPFSVFAWVKGGAADQGIIFQTGGANWLMADPNGMLMTELGAGGRSGKPLSSAAIITDGNWHRVGLTWDGFNRVLYVDDAEVKRDSQSPPTAATTSLQFGARVGLPAGSFWFGLIDDVRVHNRAIVP